MKSEAFPLLWISAWNDSGGGFLHRLFDGHPECFVWPFELQLGSATRSDGFASWFRAKYRWPDLAGRLDCDVEELFDLFLDDELKGRLRDGAASKFAAFDLELSADEWRREFAAHLPVPPRRPEQVVAAYVRALFSSWRNRRTSGREWLYVGHCPTIVVDADEILGECPGVRMLHVVRRPTSGFADFRRRVPEMRLDVYCRKWALVNALGFTFATKYPRRVSIVRLDELIADRRAMLRRLSAWAGIGWAPVLEAPTWNGEMLDRLSPFGGVPEVSAEHERDAEASLSDAEREAIARATGVVQEMLELR